MSLKSNLFGPDGRFASENTPAVKGQIEIGDQSSWAISVGLLPANVRRAPIIGSVANPSAVAAVKVPGIVIGHN